MNCNNCGEKIEQGDKFCKNCGQNQIIKTISEESNDDNLLESEEYDNDLDDIKSENELISGNEFQAVAPKKENFLKKVFKGLGTGGLVLGGGFLYISFTILQFLFTAFAGLSMIGLAISLFSKGSIILGLVALFIGTPLAIILANYFFIFLLALSIITLIIFGIIYLFGFNVSFSSVWGGIWLVIKVLALGGMTFFVISSFVQAMKNKDIVSFFKKNWFYILLLFFIFWSFF
ncbi:MAG: zinc ribbon domain-containing protein [Endomicrobiales bacterium]|nr:zinc ribbon domain-containing protein [Endomicrobiales bacterium]